MCVAFQVEFFVGHVIVTTGLGNSIAEVELLPGAPQGGDQRRTAAVHPPEVGRRAAGGHVAEDRRGETSAAVQRRAAAGQEPEDRRAVPVAETGAQDGAGSAEQNVRGRDQALHNPSTQGQGPDLIASRRRRRRRPRRQKRRPTV